MAKINVMKPTGSEMLSLLSAFKTENLTYVIFDSEKVGSMGLPIIYISKLTEKLEKITDDNEWQSVKNSLKGIINGTNFEYVKVGDTLNADEAFYTPLTLPQSSFDLIKSRYVVADSDTGEAKALEQPVAIDVLPNPEAANQAAVNYSAVSPVPVADTSVENTPIVSTNSEIPNTVTSEVVNEVSNVPTVEPGMPQINAEESTSYTATSNVSSESASALTPEADISPTTSINEVPKVSIEEAKEEAPIVKFDTNTFMQDKETFLKACENMFDALVSKYQKQLDDLERREQSLKNKELEVETKLNNASEHLANAEAREQVANIAHDNAQRIMDINNLMPSNPNVN